MIVGTLWTNLAIQAITFATSVLSARILGPIGRGELALVLLYPQLVAGIALLGVDRAIAILGGRGELARPMTTVVKLALLLSIPAMAAGYATVSWRVADAHLVGLATMYLAYAPAMYFFTLVVFLFNGSGDFVRFNRVRLGFYVANLALVLAIWAVAPTRALDWVVLANLASAYAALAMAVWMLRGFKHLENGGATASGKGDMLTVLGMAVAFALPLTLAQLSASAYQIALEYRMGVGALGLFVVYFSYSRLLSPVGSAIGSHVFHLGIAGKGRDIARIFRQSLVVYLICAVPLWLVAGWLIPLVFGRDFVVDGGAVGLLFLSSLFALLANSMAEFLSGRKKIGADTSGQGIYLFTLAALCWWLVPAFGLGGMALSLAIADLFRCGYLVVQVSRETELGSGEFWRFTRTDVAALVQAGGRVLHGFFAWR
jgi:O-antigen/teichoic acid export membrane protein